MTAPRRVASSRYTDPAFLSLERERVFATSWLCAGSTAALRGVGDYFTFDEGGLALIVLRDADRTLRAYHNTCRHRGTRLLDGRGTVKAIRCPYHDWKYALDGRLRHVPGQDGFEALDKSTLGLVPVRASEWLGLAWFCLDPAAPTFESTLGTLPTELAPYRLEEMRPIQEVTWTEPMNWKAILDNATESYHLPFVHGGSVDAHVKERPEFTTYGEHYRLTLAIANYGVRRAIDTLTMRAGPYTERQRAALHKYVLFPNFLMNVLPYHWTIFQVWPIDVNTSRFFYGFYLRDGARGLEWLRAHATWAASRWILHEDMGILNRFQRGVATARSPEHVFHAQEGAIAHFHDVLSRRIEGR